MRRLIIVIIMTMLVGCAGKPEQPSHGTVYIHPQWPDPVQRIDIKWHQFVEDDKVYYALSYGDSIVLATYLQDILRYINKSNNMLCYYRRELNEARCEQYTKEP